MNDYAKSLGDAVKRTRGKMKMTQVEVAAKANIDSRTVLNIENYNGNPKLEVLYPLVRALNLDTQDIFYPEIENASTVIKQLQQLISGCTEEEAEALIPIITSVLSVLRDHETKTIK